MRVELPTKVNGTAQYSIDVQLPGMLYGAVLRGPVEGTSPESIGRCGGARGSGRHAHRAHAFRRRRDRRDAVGGVRSEERAESHMDRRARAFGHDSDRAIPVYSAAARDLGRAGKPWDTAGDARSAMQKAVKTYESEFVCDYSYHAQMEPLNSVASVSPAGDACEIWCGTQSQTMAVAASPRRSASRWRR